MSEKEHDNHTTGLGWLDVLFISLLVNAIAFAGYDFFCAEKVRTVDLKGWLHTQSALLAAGEIDRKEWQRRLDRVEYQLDQEAKRHPETTLLLKEVVLRGGHELDLAD